MLFLFLFLFLLDHNMSMTFLSIIITSRDGHIVLYTNGNFHCQVAERREVHHTEAKYLTPRAAESARNGPLRSLTSTPGHPERGREEVS